MFENENCKKNNYTNLIQVYPFPIELYYINVYQLM